MIEGFVGERCPNCGAEAEVKFSPEVGKWLDCPEPTCKAYKMPNSKWSPGYGGERRDEK